MNPTPSPFYLDWTFWTAVVAFVAVILSQVPPVRILFRRAAIKVEPYDRLNVTHHLGNPNVHLHVQLRNTGGRSVRVSSVSLAVPRDDGPNAALQAQGFAW